MRIVYLNPGGALGGAERVLLSYLTEIRRHLPQAQLTLIAGSDGPLLEKSQRLGVATIVLPLDQGVAGLGDSERKRASGSPLAWFARALPALPATWHYASRLRRLLTRLSPDLIHSNGLKMHVFARFARPARVPIIWHLHDFYGLRPIVPPLIKTIRRGLCGAIAISKAVARDARHLLPGLPIEVIFNSVDTDLFCPGYENGATLDRLAGLPVLPPNTLRVGLVATYAQWKGHEVFLEAIARLIRHSSVSTARFYIVGGPIYFTRAQLSEEWLRRRALDLGIADRVDFVPFQQDTVGIYRALDIVVHASTQPEPFGLTVAEAMACGRAAIVSRAGGAVELFTPDQDAVGVPPGDAAALAEAIRRLGNDADERRRLGSNARATALRLFQFGTTRTPSCASFIDAFWR